VCVVLLGAAEDTHPSARSDHHGEATPIPRKDVVVKIRRRGNEWIARDQHGSNGLYTRRKEEGRRGGEDEEKEAIEMSYLSQSDKK